MHIIKLAILACGLAFCIHVPFASADDTERCEAISDSVPDTMVVDLFDAAAPPERRAKALDLLRKNAEIERCPGLGYSLGLLYRHGPDLAGNILPRDIDKAREFLLGAAESGHLTAYSDLAEMEMQQGNARKAMHWTQVYLYFLTRHSITFDRNSGGFDRSGYNADLLSRAEGVWRTQKPRPEREVMLADLQGYLASRGELVLAELKKDEEENRKFRAGEDKDELQFKRVTRACHADLGRISSGYAMYLIVPAWEGSNPQLQLGAWSVLL